MKLDLNKYEAEFILWSLEWLQNSNSKLPAEQQQKIIDFEIEKLQTKIKEMLCQE